MTKSLQSAADARIRIGRIGKPHGVRGELTIFPLTDFPERFADMTEVYVGDTLRAVKNVRYHQDKVLMTFAGYEVREKAAELTGQFLSVDRADVVPLEEGEYYTFDIIGLTVYDEDGTKLGTVTDVLETGSNDVYVVTPSKAQAEAGNGQDILVPALKTVVRSISLAEQKMVVKMPEVLE